MALIPLKQTVTIQRKGELNKWGKPISTQTPITLKCRFTESVKLNRHTMNSNNLTSISSDEVVDVGKFTFEGFADIKMTDELIYIDEIEEKYVYVPLNIKRVRGLDSKVLFTVVTV